MTLVQALILGLIQGTTEFLPISSSGHLVFVPALFGWSDQGLAFDVVIHLGSLVAVVIYFRSVLWRLLKALFVTCDPGSPIKSGMTGDRKLACLLILSIIPAGIVGLFFGDHIETVLRATWVVGVGLIVWGIVLGVADWYGKKIAQKKQHTDVKDTSWKQALFIACAQAIALIPGTSRSGITMTAGLFAKLDKKSAASFSFLMSVPVIAVAGAVKMQELLSQDSVIIDWSAYSIGFAAAAVSGYLAIAGLMKLIQRWSYTPFVIYRIVVGALILLFLV